jgi:tetratricopeptide (TPR) repeat protein
MSLDQNAKQLVTLGREFYIAGEYDKAERYLGKLVADGECHFADVYNMLGIIYHSRAQFARAQAAFEEALRINPRYTEAALNLSVTYNDLGKYAEAKDTYQAALGRARARSGDIDPFVKGKIANMHADLGDVYRGIGQFLAAVREYKKALELGPHFPDIRVKLGKTYQDMGDVEAAVEEFRAVLAERPGFVPAILCLGLALYALGQRDDAAAQFEEALRVDPTEKRAPIYLNMVRS